MSVKTFAPHSAAPGGVSVRGAIRRTSAPRTFRQATFERATRLCRMSPQIAMRMPPMSPTRRRMVSASSRACVGCSCVPSPALITAQSTLRDSSFTAPDEPWRITSRSGRMALSVIAVSISVSPFFTEEVAIGIVTTSAPRRRPAISNEPCVRVEFSKKRLTSVRPASTSACFTRLRLSST